MKQSILRAFVGRVVVVLLVLAVLNARARADQSAGKSARTRAADAPGVTTASPVSEDAHPVETAVAPPKPFSLLAPLPGELSPPRENQYELRRADDGSGDLAYRASAFEARVHRDGSVTFRDKSLASSLLPAWIPRRTGARGPTLQGSLRNLLIGRTAGPSGSPSSPRGDAQDPPPETRAINPAVTPYRPDPREACRYPQACFFDAKVMVLGVTGTLDLTDALMRLSGQDPYRYEKARFMTHTSELRIRLAARAHGDDVRQATASLRSELESIAGNERLTPAERRAVLDGLAAEMDATTDEGRHARAQIEAFVRERFPTPDGGR